MWINNKHKFIFCGHPSFEPSLAPIRESEVSQLTPGTAYLIIYTLTGEYTVFTVEQCAQSRAADPAGKVVSGLRKTLDKDPAFF